MKKTILLTLLLFIFTCSAYKTLAMDGIIPANTATHTATKNGNWSDRSTWGGKQIPGYGAIVYIPKGINVEYDMNSDVQIFVIRNDGSFQMRSFNNKPRKLVVDTFFNMANSTLNIKAWRAGSANIDIIIRPFFISGMKNGSSSSPNPWNSAAKNHYSDGAPVYDHFGKKLPSDGLGVLGRYGWDPNQVSLGLMTMGKVRVVGMDKSDFSMCKSNVNSGSTIINLNSNMYGWKVGDRIFLTGTESITQNEDFVIKAINSAGNRITLDKPIKYKHTGVSKENLYPYIGNVTRNITIRSQYTRMDINHTRRGHTMFMFNGDIRIQNTAFHDLGRSHKNNLLDDLKYQVEINGSGNQQKINFIGLNGDKAAPKDIENQRGRYSFHFHKSLRGQNREKLIIATGNAVVGSPGWGMVHHDSHANFTSNVVYKVEGGGMIAESGSETGIWKNNLVAGVYPDKTKLLKAFTDRGAAFFPPPIRRRARAALDDDFRAGSAYGLQGRAVRMVNNVAAGSFRGYNYQGDGENLQGIADRLDVSVFEKEGTVNPFPTNTTIERNAAPLIEFSGNISASCNVGFKSQVRNKYAYHRVLSVIDNFKAWNTNPFGIYISSNFGYLFKNSYIHGRLNARKSIGCLTFGIDNFNFSNVVFENFKNKTISIRDGDGSPSGLHPKAELVFHNVTWRNSKNKPYADFDIGKAVIKNNSNTNIVNAITFTRNGSMDTTLDVSKRDFKVTIDGRITDSAGKNDFVNYTPKNNPITKRVYDFKNEEGIRKYLKIRKDANGRNYGILTEFISDRITGKITPINFRININGLKGVKQLDDIASSDLKVYPNPANNTLTISQKTENFYLTIYDINGREIKNLPTNSENFDIDVSNLSDGMYFIKSNKETVKFLIKH